MSEEIKPGYYWANVKAGGGWDREWSLEVIEYWWVNEYAAWDETEEREYQWNRCGSDVPLHHTEFDLIPNGGPLIPPVIPIEMLDPHPAAVKLVEDIKPVRDNGSDE